MLQVFVSLKSLLLKLGGFPLGQRMGEDQEAMAASGFVWPYRLFAATLKRIPFGGG